MPWELADELPTLRLQILTPTIDVIVERRHGDRRSSPTRRLEQCRRTEERRRIRNRDGRRVGPRRARLAAVEPPMLHSLGGGYSERLAFVERLEPNEEHSEDLDTARLITRYQAGNEQVFAEIYSRYFFRVYSYMRSAFEDEYAAEDTTQHVFLKVMEALPRYERRKQPFRAWLFTIARNEAIRYLEKRSRIQIVDPADLVERPLAVAGAAETLAARTWLTDRELSMLIERLPVAQRQVLLLRYLMDFTTSEIATVLCRTRDDVRTLQSRALRFLEQRLRALGREPHGPAGAGQAPPACLPAHHRV